jgi:hypothetical protein
VKRPSIADIIVVVDSSPTLRGRDAITRARIITGEALSVGF